MVTIKKIVKKVPNTFKKEVQHVKQTSEPATVPLAKPDADMETVFPKTALCDLKGRGCNSVFF